MCDNERLSPDRLFKIRQEIEEASKTGGPEWEVPSLLLREVRALQTELKRLKKQDGNCKLWLIDYNMHTYDEYDGHVVAANTEKEALWRAYAVGGSPEKRDIPETPSVICIADTSIYHLGEDILNSFNAG